MVRIRYYLRCVSRSYSCLSSLSEIATEIKHFHPRTAVTVVHAGDKLINPTYPDKVSSQRGLISTSGTVLTDAFFRFDLSVQFRDRVKRRVEEAGVRVILGDRVLDIPDDGLAGENGKPVALRTANGTTIEADLFVSYPPQGFVSFD